MALIVDQKSINAEQNKIESIKLKNHKQKIPLKLTIFGLNTPKLFAGICHC